MMQWSIDWKMRQKTTVFCGSGVGLFPKELVIEATTSEILKRRLVSRLYEHRETPTVLATPGIVLRVVRLIGFKTNMEEYRFIDLLIDVLQPKKRDASYEPADVNVDESDEESEEEEETESEQSEEEEEEEER